MFSRILPGILAIAMFSGCTFFRKTSEHYANYTYDSPDQPKVSPQISALHDSMFIVDLHADSLLWGRDITEGSDTGHVDLIRLHRGNVALQVFAVVTQTPQPTRDECIKTSVHTVKECYKDDNSGHLNFFDKEAAALKQAKRMDGYIRQSVAKHSKDPSHPYFMWIRFIDDLELLIKRRQNMEPVTGVLLALEGAHWIGGDETAIRQGVSRLYGAGFRMVAATHRFNNKLGAASEGCDQLEGLNEMGEMFIKAAYENDMIIDLAHLSDMSIDDALDIHDGSNHVITHPVVSHTGLRSDCNTTVPDYCKPEPPLPVKLFNKKWAAGCTAERNLPDEKVQQIARAGGIIGIGFWPQAVGCGYASIARVYRSVHTVLSEPSFVDEMNKKLDGHYNPAAHITFGSDFDGATRLPFDVSQLRYLTASLYEYGRFSKDDLRHIAGQNACRIIATRLSGGDTQRAMKMCSIENLTKAAQRTRR